MSKVKQVYHGWVVVESGGKDLADTVHVEYRDGSGKRRRMTMDRHGESGCVEAVEWWDKRLGTNAKLEPTLKGCYRVYTEEVV